MKRRHFLTSSLAASTALGGGGKVDAQSTASANSRQYYELRKYKLESGPEQKLADKYVSQALIPALNKLGVTPVGAFTLYLGPETPTLYLLLPCKSLEALVTSELHLAQDAEFVKAADFFWAAPAKEPAFVRAESSLMIAFEGQPSLTLPPATAQNGKRVFQLRTYESPTQADHVRKIEMFHAGEFKIFERAGFWPVFYGDTLIGPRLPNLTYMLSFPELGEMEAKWNAFQSDPEWKKLTQSPRYNYESLVSNITNLILQPTPYSQI